MRRLINSSRFVSLSAMAAASLLFLVQLFFTPPPAAAQNDCKTYFALSPLSPAVLDLLGSAPSNRGPFVSPELRKLQNWDFPDKVTPWHERPSAQEMARLRQDAAKEVPKSGTPSQSSRYELRNEAAGDWPGLEKWFAKDGPKKLPGMCVEPEKAAYLLAVGIIAQPGPDVALSNAAAREEYNQSVVPQDSSIGQNAATVTPGGEHRPADQLAGLSGSDSSGGYTCAYLYRSTAPGGAPQPTPELYYCHSGSGMPKSVVTTMLKYVAKQGLP